MLFIYFSLIFLWSLSLALEFSNWNTKHSNVEINLLSIFSQITGKLVDVRIQNAINLQGLPISEWYHVIRVIFLVEFNYYILNPATHICYIVNIKLSIKNQLKTDIINYITVKHTHNNRFTSRLCELQNPHEDNDDDDIYDRPHIIARHVSPIPAL